MSDELSTIALRASFEGIEFPVSECPYEFAHDGVEHTVYGRDGADCEPTGQGPYRGTLTLPLFSDVDDFVGVDMFALARELLGVIGTTPIGDLVHPVLGTVRAFMKRAAGEGNPDSRSGETLKLEWAEHRASVQLLVGQSGETPADTTQALTSQADAADTELAQLVPADEYTSCREVVAEQLDVINDAAARPADIDAAVRAIVAVVESNLAHPDVESVQGAAASLELERLRARTYSLRDTLLVGQRRANTITTPREMTVFELALQAYGDAREYQRLIDANPMLASDPIFIPAGATVIAPPIE